MELISELLQAVLETALPILVVAGASWLIGKTLEIFRKLKDRNPELYEILKAVCERAVLAAEQVYKSGPGEEKKKYALNTAEQYLKAKGITLDLTVIDAYIEAAVMDMNLDAWKLNMEAASLGLRTAPDESQVPEEGAE